MRPWSTNQNRVFGLIEFHIFADYLSLYSNENSFLNARYNVKQKKQTYQNRRRLLTLVLLIHFTFAFVLMIPQVLLPFWQESFNLSSTVAAVLGSVFFIAYGLTAVPQSFLLARIRLKPFTLWASMLILVSSIVFVIRPTYELGLITFFFMGIGVTALQMAGSLVVKQLDDDPQKYSRNYSLVLVIIGVGGLSGGLLIGAIVDQLQLHWSTLYYLFAALAGFLALMTLFTPLSGETAEKETTTTNLKAYRAIFTDPRLARYTLGIFIYLGVEIGVATWITTFLITEFQVEKVAAAATVSLYWLMQTIGRLLGGVILNYIRPAKLLAVFAAGCAVALVMALLAPTPILATIGFGLVGFSTSIMYPVLFAAGMSQVDRSQENVAAGVLSAAVIGGAVTPPLIGVLSQATGSLHISLAMVIITSLGYIGVLAIRSIRTEQSRAIITTEPA
jgi:FHS family L-fucose permease-like MFS transporter